MPSKLGFSSYLRRCVGYCAEQSKTTINVAMNRRTCATAHYSPTKAHDQLTKSDFGNWDCRGLGIDTLQVQ